MAIMNEEAVSAELDRLGVRDLHPGLSELALSLGRMADQAETPAALASVAAPLRSVLLDLCKLQPVKAEGDALDDLATRRAKRRGA